MLINDTRLSLSGINYSLLARPSFALLTRERVLSELMIVAEVKNANH